MTDKQIKEEIKHINKRNQEYIAENNRMTKNIIDGVDVSGCVAFKYDGVKKPLCRADGITSVYKSCFCADIPNCYYKQLQHEKRKLNKIRKICNKFTPDNYKILLILNGGIVDE